MKRLGNAMLCQGEWWLCLWILGHHVIVTGTQGEAGGREVGSRKDVHITATMLPKYHKVLRKQTGKAFRQPRGSAQEVSQPQLRREHLLMPSPEGNIWLLRD